MLHPALDSLTRTFARDGSPRVLGKRPRASIPTYDAAVMEVGARRRNQPAPPRVLFEALTDPGRDPGRPWLLLLDDERAPSIVEAERPGLVVWTSLWARRPEALIRFELPSDRSGAGTDLRWVLLVDDQPLEASLLGHMLRRINELINANLRHTFGQ